MTDHTKTPWRIVSRTDGADIVTGDYPGGRARLIASCWSGGSDDADDAARANAEFILRAVNAHDDLLAALRGMVEMFEHRIYNRPGPIDAAQRWDAARAAIAKAEGTK